MPLYAMNVPGYTYRKAEPKDREALLALLAKQAELEQEKLVTLPERFRGAYVDDEIRAGHLFVAEQQQSQHPERANIVGCKKLYLLNDDRKKLNLLAHELRCIGTGARLACAGVVDHDGKYAPTEYAPTEDELKNMCSVCIYDGNDFTLPVARGHGINSQLTAVALDSAKSDVVKMYHDTQEGHIALAYGLVQANAGEQPGQKPDRTPGIARLFATFVRTTGLTAANKLAHYRYHAYKPTFDPKAETCEPMSDEHSVPGFGCLLVSECKKEDNDVQK